MTSAQREGMTGVHDAAQATRRYYHDGDTDSFGDENDFLDSCSGAPTEYVLNDSDCCDEDEFVRPNQSDFFGDLITKCDLDLDHDYDCDGVETRKFRVLECGASCVGQGWLSEPVVCGASQKWAKCTKVNEGSSSEFVCERVFEQYGKVSCK